MINIKSKLENTLEVLRQDLRVLRVDRANAGMVELIMVNVYENKMPLNQVASVSIPSHNQILITPWDVGVLSAIQSAIQNSQLQINPIVEGNSIRLTLPPLTEETRRDLVKDVSKYVEEAKVSIRNIREEVLKDLETLSEDEKFRQEKEIQKMIDEYNAKIKEIQEHKEKEILTN